MVFLGGSKISLKYSIPSIELSVEKNTDNVPNDGRYYLILKGKIIASWKNEKQALKAYKEKAKELGYKPETSQPKIDLVKEATDKFFEKYDRYWNNSHKFRKGGRGR